MLIPLTSLLSNPFVSGGLAFGSLGFLLGYVKSVPTKLFAFVRSKFMYTVQISSEDKAFELFNNWIINTDYGKKASIVRLRSDYDDQTSRHILALTPGEGLHVFKHNGKKIWAQIERSEPKGDGGQGGTPLPNYSIKMSTLGTSRKYINGFVAEIEKAQNDQYKDKIILMNFDSHRDWYVGNYTERRTKEQLFFNGNVVEDIIRDIKHFESQKEWYQKMGIPHTRGYLLHGPPGNGKTSLIRCVATEMNKKICVVKLDVLNEQNLQYALNRSPKNSIILMEDVDALFYDNKMNESEKDESGNIIKISPSEYPYNRKKGASLTSLSSIFNALDGVMVAEDRILFTTSNRPEILDKAFIRPGRIDKHILIDNATKEQMKQYYQHFFLDDAEEMADDWISNLGESERSMAEIQERLLTERELRYQMALKNGQIKELVSIQIEQKQKITMPKATKYVYGSAPRSNGLAASVSKHGKW